MINGNQVIMKVIELLMLLIAVVSLITYLPITTAAKGTSKPFIRHWVRAAQKYSTARVVTIVCSDHTEKKDFLKLMKAPLNTFKFVSNISGGRGFPGNNGLFIICEDDWPNVSTSLFAQENPVTFSGTVILLANKSNSSISGLFTNTYPQPRIDQEFYVLNADTGCMNEAYFLAKDFLVYDELICASEAEGIFRFISKTPLLQRRNNFRGVKLRMLTENDGTNIKLHQDVLKSTSRPQGHPDDLFRISKSQISGAFYDLLVILEQEMNFTAELFLRNRRSWGTYNFTSKKAMGMLLNAERGEVDLIFSTYSMTAERNQVVKWLFPIVTETMAIFVAKTEWKKKIPWLLYVYPFTMDLWCFLLGNLFLVASMLVVLRRATAVVTRSKNVPNWNYGLLLWTVFCSYFGMKPTGISEGDTTHQHASPVRIVIFTMALVGTVVFMSYRAALTSELSVGLVKPPFSDLQEFLDSEY